MADIDIEMPTKGELVAAAREAHRLEVRADVAKLTTVALMCDVWSVVDDSAFDPRGDADPKVLFGERLVSPGGAGTPQVAEFLALELGPALQISPESAHTLIADVLNLRHRLPILWEHTINGRVRAWAARVAAQTTEMLPLAKARELDARLAPLVDGWTEGKLVREVERLTALLDDDAEERRKRRHEHRYVEVTGDLDGSAHLEARLDAAAAVHLDATLDRAARTLARGGVEGTHRARRADALGLLAHPGRAHLILDEGLPFEEAADGGLVPSVATGAPAPTAGACSHGAELIVRVRSWEMSAGLGGVLEGFGPVTSTHLGEILAGCSKVVVQPVIDLKEPFAVSTYRPSPQLKWRVAERDQRELYPFSNRRARSRLIDHDHTVPAAEGGPTESGNLASLSRRPHRSRTHAGFRVDQPTPGTLHWRTPAGQEFWTNAHGTWDHPPPEHHMNEPHDTTRVMLQMALEITAKHRPPPEADPPECPPDPVIHPPEIGPVECVGLCPRRPHHASECAPPF